MTKLLTVDNLEIEFEKQDPSHACKWCIYIRLKKNDKEQTFLMIKTDEKPFTRFTHNSGKLVALSDESLSDIMFNSVNLSPVVEEFNKKNKDTKH